MNDGTRLNKYLASCGVGSRRACDELIQQGHVEVNGRPCLNPAERVQPGDFVKVDGKRVAVRETGVIAFHKPRGLVCSRDDEFERETIYAILPSSLHHFHHVGRLDKESEGLLILTNDGHISQSMIHPSKAIEKEYIVTANQPVLSEHLELFTSGIYVDGEKLRAKQIERLSARRVRIILETGIKRQIRQMFQALSYKVLRLVRIRIGTFELVDLAPGKYRTLNAREIAQLTVNPRRRAPSGKPSKNSSPRAGSSPSKPAKPSPKSTAKPASRPARKSAFKPAPSTGADALAPRTTGPRAKRPHSARAPRKKSGNLRRKGKF